mgnify:CR=1 FL=1
MYLALKTGTVDAQDNPLPTNDSAKFYEVTKQIILTSHLVDQNYVAFSKRVWDRLTPAQRDWVIEGSPHWKGEWNKQWYGVRRFFGYLESKAYKMHIRVLLSKYRSYTPCTACGGARLKLEALLWRLGSKADADAVLPPAQRFLPVGAAWSRAWPPATACCWRPRTPAERRSTSPASIRTAPATLRCAAGACR